MKRGSMLFCFNGLFGARRGAGTAQQGVNYCTIILTLECFIAINNCFRVLNTFSHTVKSRNGKYLLMGEIPGGLGTHHQPGHPPWVFLLILICSWMILEPCLALKVRGPKALLFPVGEVALPANLFMDTLVLGSNSHLFAAYFRQINFSHAKPHIQSPPTKLLTSEMCASLFRKQKRDGFGKSLLPFCAV